ncbi:kinase-like protein [Zopfia rhizophila CBS 207.26]|uniref:EKC/KEOPS complex subunit BUD32 n=1 Tax=Zopfia rhizophila CBS 207.26 TaxID=1314779 RepID=A0A6A6E3X2_9PEZI|nr:kinase-like protein [Zopfia rhizophila CBS 207.26]
MTDPAPPEPQPAQPQHILSLPFTTSNLTLLTQGAEALVYRTTFLTPSTPCVLKYRPPKPYRHPTLDKRLTKARLLAEARVLVKCRKEFMGVEGAGVSVPAVLGADWEMGWVVLEWVDGWTVRKCLDEWIHTLGLKGERQGGGREEGADGGGRQKEEPLWDLMRKVGKAVGKLHEIGVCHGDLTTSNLMVRRVAYTSQEQEKNTGVRHVGRQTVSAMREAAITESDAPPEPSSQTAEQQPPNLNGDIVLIDFGLATQTVQDEDRAVDLYVLERAFAATHPAAEPLFREVLRVYGESFKGARTVLKRLEDVRLRGRKRSMLG